jgi:hypothetical protein
MFEVGNIAARLSGIFSDDGFKKFNRAYDDSSVKAKKPVDAKLGATVDDAGFVSASAKVAAYGASRAQAHLSVEDRDANLKILQLQGAITILEHQIEEDRSIHIDTGAAEAKLLLLKNRLGALNRELAEGQLRREVGTLGLALEDLGLKAEEAGTGGSGGGGGISSLAGSIGPLGMAAAAASPVILGLGGALASLVGSAGAAAGGAGALGTGVIGSLSVGLLSIVGVAKPMATEFKNVNKAMDTYTQTVSKFGPKSTQAAAAQKDLNQQIKANGGPQIEQIIKRVDRLGEAWKKVTRPGQRALAGLINTGVTNAQEILPSVGKDVNQNVSAFADAAAKGIKELRQGGLLDILASLSHTFQRDIGPAIDAVSKLLLGFGNIARATGPYVDKLVGGIDGLATRFFNATKNTEGLHKTLSGLMGQLGSWVGLFAALGRVLFTFFSGGAAQGKGMVDTVTSLLNRWNDWMKSISGSKAMQSFFKDARELTSAFFHVLAPLIGAIGILLRTSMPAFTTAFKILRPIAEAIFVVISDLSSLLGGKVVRGLLAVAAAWGLWTGAVAAFGLIMAANPVTLIIAAIAALGIGLMEAWKHSETFRKVVTAVFDAVLSTAKGLAAGFLDMISVFLHGIGSMIGMAEKIPGVGKKFHGLHDEIDAATGKIDSWRDSLRNADTQHGRTSGSLDALAGSAVNASTITGKALKSMGDDLNTLLKGTGAKAINFTFSKPLTADLRHGGAGSQQASAPGRYRGGPVGGNSTADDHMVVDLKTGQPKALISGTEGILTSSQMGEVNNALAFASMFGESRFGGLNDLWGGMTMPHYATGGALERANSLDRMHLPYIWGGHHGDRGAIQNPRPGLDCSSTVSYVLGIPPRVSGQFRNFGSPGKGPITIYANDGHVFMSLFGRGFGTSHENPDGGPGWLSYNERPGFTVRSVGANWAGVGDVNTPHIKGPAGALRTAAQAAINRAGRAANSYVNTAMGSLDNPAGQPLNEPLSASVSAVNHVFPLHHTGTPGTMLSSSTVQAIANAKGFTPALAADQIAHGESNRMPGIVEWPPEADGAQGIGLMQMTTGHVDPPVVSLINRLGGWGQMRNPVKNMEAASLLKRIGGLGRWHGTRYLTAAVRGGRLRRFAGGGPLARAASTRPAPHRAAPRGSQINLNNLSKWAGLPGIPDLSALDASIEGLQSTYNAQNQYSTLIDGQITPADMNPLIRIRESIVGTLQQESVAIGTARPQLAGSLADRRRAQGDVERAKRQTDTQIARLKQGLKAETRRLATTRHTRSAEVMKAAETLAQQTGKLTNAQSDNVDRIHTVDSSYQSRLSNLRSQLAAVPKGTGYNNSNDKRRTALHAQITALEGKRTTALKGLSSHGAAIRGQQAKLRAQVAAQRRKFASRGFDDAWAFQIRRWKVQDALDRLQAKSKELGASDRAIIKQEGQILSAQAALDTRATALPTTITQAIIDTLSLQQQAGVPLGGFGGLPAGDAAGIAAFLGLEAPTGGNVDGSIPLESSSTGAGLTADQQALLDQATTLKNIVASGNFINTASTSVLGPLNPSSIGAAAAPLTLSGTSSPGSASFAAGGSSGSPTIVFQSYVPPSPQQAHELAGYVTSGLGYQGLVGSPRQVLGV